MLNNTKRTKIVCTLGPSSEKEEILTKLVENGLNVWCYTGFTYEMMLLSPKKRKLLEQIDVLVDGKFVLEKKSLDVKFDAIYTGFLGSKEQIDVAIYIGDTYKDYLAAKDNNLPFSFFDNCPNNQDDAANNS